MEKETDAHNLLRHWRSLEYIWLPYDWNTEDKEVECISKEENEQKYCLANTKAFENMSCERLATLKYFFWTYAQL